MSIGGGGEDVLIRISDSGPTNCVKIDSGLGLEVVVLDEDAVVEEVVEGDVAVVGVVVEVLSEVVEVLEGVVLGVVDGVVVEVLTEVVEEVVEDGGRHLSTACSR